MGKGMFATRDFKRGDLIIDERPILITPKAVPVIPITPAHYTLEQALQVQIHEYEKLLKALVNRLRADKKAAFMSLANSHEHDGSGPIYGRIRTNAFGMPNLFRDKGRSRFRSCILWLTLNMLRLQARLSGRRILWRLGQLVSHEP